MNMIIFILSLITISNLFQLSLGGCTIATECVEIDDFTCLTFNGNVIPDNKTCADLGVYTMGSCCVGNCFFSTQTFCKFLVGGAWSSGDDTCECAPVMSCCRPDGECVVEDESSCNDAGGVFAEEQCESDWCHAEWGSCCTGETCFELPKGYCPGAWVGETTCDDTCPVANIEIDLSISDPNATGRCCLVNSCLESTQDGCLILGGFYQEGVGCNPSNPCFTVGACLRADLCLNPVRESICDTYGGTFLEGGQCPNEEQGICIYRSGRYCSPFSLKECAAVSGIWDNEIFQCPEGFPPLGSCCIGGACVYTNERTCQLQSLSFKEGELCEENQQCIFVDPNVGDGACCVRGLCISEEPISVLDCARNAFINGETLGESTNVIFTPNVYCQGLCNGESEISIPLGKAEFIKIAKEKNLNWRSLSVAVQGNGSVLEFGSMNLENGSNASFTSLILNITSINSEASSQSIIQSTGSISIMQLSSSTLLVNSASINIYSMSINGNSKATISNSQIEIGNLTIAPGSTLKLSTDNNLIITNCVDIKGKLDLSVSDENMTSLETQGSLDLVYLNSNCINQDIDYGLSQELSTECYTHQLSGQTGNLILSMSFLCEENSVLALSVNILIILAVLY